MTHQEVISRHPTNPDLKDICEGSNTPVIVNKREILPNKRQVNKAYCRFCHTWQNYEEKET